MRKRDLPCRAGPAATLAVLLWASAAHAAPPIRTGDRNAVPACVTPQRLMAFVADRNPNADPRYDRIATFYKEFGEAWHVRWDYAFFQMVLETNYLSYRRDDGGRGDVREDQNNFAGIGATGNGVRGERFPDIKTGVHAQIQHLVAYSGERVEDPLAKRTRENQDDIISLSRRVPHPMTFGDLARRWATDRAYGKSIDIVAGLFRSKYCVEPTVQAADDLVVPAPQPVKRVKFFPFRPPSGLGGPKPDHLAGPDIDANATEEILPWLSEPVKRPVTPKAKSNAAKKTKTPAANKDAAPARSQVKTIWSRGDTKTPSLPASVPPPIADDTPARARATVDKADADAGANGATAAPVSNTDDQSPWLPTFHIAPVAAVTASRLGGPLPDLAPTNGPFPSSPYGKCHIFSASYGGTKTLLIRSKTGDELTLTTLTVIDGFEKSMFQNYANAEAKGAEIVGEYETADAALVDALENCPKE